MSKIYNLAQIKGVLKSLQPIQEIEEGFVAYSAGKAVIPPVGEMLFKDPPGDIHIKYGYLLDDDYYVIKIASGFFESPSSSRYTSDGLILLFKKGTGELACALLDECHLTNVRTAAAGAVSAKYLAPKNIDCIGILGAGTQGRMQVEYLAPVIDCKEVMVWGMNQNELDDYKKDMEPLGYRIQTTLNTEDIADRCNLIITATPSKSPLLSADKIRKGTHITTMGSDTSEKNELDTKYFYELTVEGSNATMYNRRRSFRTLPDPEEMRDEKKNPRGLFNFSFEYACGNSQSSNGFGPALPTFWTMLDQIKDKINFAILNGDWLYETKRDYQPESWLKQVGLTKDQTPDVVKYAPTIVGVWENYKTYLDRGHNLALWHRVVPSFYTIDDHEILDNTYGAGQIGRSNRKAVFRDVAVQAWHDYLAWSNPTHFNQDIVFGKAKLRGGSDVLEDKNADFTTLDLSQAATLHIHWGGRMTAHAERPGRPNRAIPIAVCMRLSR